MSKEFHGGPESPSVSLRGDTREVFRAHTPPPEPVPGVSGPTFVAHDGQVWRRSMIGWTYLQNPEWMLALFRESEADTADWFHKRAAELADEIEAAIASLKTPSERKAA